ncbi:hypothetical protein [Sulfobacillus thermosulfidooxidans]|uniref:hypothetical protein n=1 Tax=Sulfobacillus thermosulfidooxidans TaxID=28034 RepID=UPI00056422A6|nr:hypothetical protein [Sulfobacillus thermosulfidooxidans]
MASLTVLFDVAYLAYMPSVLEKDEIRHANGYFESTRSVANALGPSMAGLLIRMLTAPFALLVNATTFVASAASVIGLPTDKRTGARKLHMNGFRLAFSGFPAIWKNPLVRPNVICTASLNFFSSVVGTLLILYLVKTGHMTSLTLGIAFLLVAWGV